MFSFRRGATLHPEFPQILLMAHRMGFTHIQVATNGSRFVNPDYVSQCEEMGLHTLYLQFDAMNDDAYMRLRGKRLLDEKTRSSAMSPRLNMRIVLVPTIAASINVDQIGPILASPRIQPHITGISIQPPLLSGVLKSAPGKRIRSTSPTWQWNSANRPD